MNPEGLVMAAMPTEATPAATKVRTGARRARRLRSGVPANTPITV